MLARSKSVLGDTQAARQAIRNAQQQFKNDGRARARIAEIVSELRLN
jgi:hypothetical protein